MSAPAFSWAVVTPDGTVASGTCDFLVIPTTRGETGVLSGHAPLVARVAPGTLRITNGAQTTLVTVGAGLAEVLDNAVRLRVEAARPVAGTAEGVGAAVDAARAQTAGDGGAAAAPAGPAS